MKRTIIYESDDGKMRREARWTDSKSLGEAKRAIEAYEEAQKAPLTKLHLPWEPKDWAGGGVFRTDNQSWNAGISDNRPIMADTMNLLPLLKELRDAWNGETNSWRAARFNTGSNKTAQKLLLAYEAIEEKAKAL